MIAVDTNILIYAHREDSEWHAAASARLAELAEGRSPWAIPWPCVHEFYSIITHPKVFAPPTSRHAALGQLEAWQESPSLMLLSEGVGYWRVLQSLVIAGKLAGPQIHDARIAALCLHHRVRELWTADRDFSRFPELTVKNPVVA